MKHEWFFESVSGTVHKFYESPADRNFTPEFLEQVIEGMQDETGQVALLVSDPLLHWKPCTQTQGKHLVPFNDIFRMFRGDLVPSRDRLFLADVIKASTNER